MDENAWLETILNRNTNDNSVAKVLNVSIKSAVPAGANYASIISRATLDVILRSGRKSKISLIIKKTHEDKEKAKILEDFSMFKVEIKFYTNTLTKYDQLMDDYQDNRDKLWCNMIGCKPYSIIVFEDLKTQNFVMADRTKLQDRNHALLVLNSLGRFHAMGYVLIKQGLVSKDDFETYIQERDSLVNNYYTEGGLRKLCKVIESDWSSEWKEIATRLRKQEKVAVKKMRDLFKSPENCFQTVLHGDVWTCNMMFKYCSYDNNIPIAVKFLDLQTIHLNSLGFDLIYFMYTCVQDRKTLWNELIAEYHKSLKTTLTDYGMGEEAPTLEQINAELKRLEYYALMMTLVVMPVIIAEGEGKFDMEKLHSEEYAEDAFSSDIFNSDCFKNAAQPVLKDFFEQGLF